MDRVQARVCRLQKRCFLLIGFIIGATIYFTTFGSLESKNNVVIAVSSSSNYYKLYDDIVALRVIVITYNRAKSLTKLLRSLDELELDGDKASLEIWIDRSKRTNSVDKKTLQAAKSYNWSRGPTRVHVHTQHVGIYGQWIDTWRPQAHLWHQGEQSNETVLRDYSKEELALILEDDLSVSKYCYRWLRAVHRAFGNRTDYLGSTLTSDEVGSYHARRRPVYGPRQDTVFMYKGVGSWGFTPDPYRWRQFQDWFHDYYNKPRSEFRPYVTGILPTQWYKTFEKRSFEDSMWTMWLIYFAHVKQLYTVYSNLAKYNGDRRSCVGINRREVGLHYYRKGRENLCQLLNIWHDNYSHFPLKITKLDWFGRPVKY